METAIQDSYCFPPENEGYNVSVRFKFNLKERRCSISDN